jgi:A/G-specific adenine glycosylase
MVIKQFQKIIRIYYKNHKRDLPWRKTRDPYKIFVSEVMLQQTQAERVIPKYKSFLKKFPTVQALASAKLADVLRQWQGLGYNRRALYLKRAAEKVVKDFGGKFPKDVKTLETLPGVGPATAGDVVIFAWNMPAVVIETNIRSVFIHFFFKGKGKVADKEIMPLVEKTLKGENAKNPREWYYALFDYGVYLKKTLNPGRRSAHHIRQSPFKGSYREKRGHILRSVLQTTKLPERSIAKKEMRKILSGLERDGFIKKRKDGSYRVK